MIKTKYKILPYFLLAISPCKIGNFGQFVKGNTYVIQVVASRTQQVEFLSDQNHTQQANIPQERSALNGQGL